MSVLIKGMEMPLNCIQCEFVRFDRYSKIYYCHETNIDIGESEEYRCPDWCPLVEIPDKHGRLIDEDDVKRRMIPLSFSVQNWISEVELSNCRTVIKAEEVNE